MKPAQKEIHPKIRNQHTNKSQNAEPMENHGIAEKIQDLAVKGGRIDKKGDEGPDFLGIPGPIASPGNVGPNGTEESTGSKEGNGRIKEDKGHIGRDGKGGIRSGTEVSHEPHEAV